MTVYPEHPPLPVSASEGSGDSDQPEPPITAETALWDLYEAIVKHVEFTKINDPFLASAISKASHYLDSISLK